MPKANKPSVADIKHKNNSGSDNWNAFLKEKGVHQNKVKKTSKQQDGNSKNTAVEKKSKKISRVVALDCEMVGIGENGKEDILARVSIVNSFGNCIYDTFVKSTAPVTDYRTDVSGVRPKDMENGKDFVQVRKDVEAIISNRVLVGHSLRNDFKVLKLKHPRHAIRDTCYFFTEKVGGSPSLKKLAALHIGIDIQEGEHNSIQDAQAAMQLYNMFKKSWESRGRSSAFCRYHELVKEVYIGTS